MITILSSNDPPTSHFTHIALLTRLKERGRKRGEPHHIVNLLPSSKFILRHTNHQYAAENESMQCLNFHRHKYKATVLLKHRRRLASDLKKKEKKSSNRVHAISSINLLRRWNMKIRTSCDWRAVHAVIISRRSYNIITIHQFFFLRSVTDSLLLHILQ